MSCRQRNGPFLPGFSFAVRLLLLVRVTAAMYSNIQDCDEGTSPSSPK
jgi:alpha-1,2-mannosyltransferase